MKLVIIQDKDGDDFAFNSEFFLAVGIATGAERVQGVRSFVLLSTGLTIHSRKEFAEQVAQINKQL